MTVLVTDKGFEQDNWRDGYVPLCAASGLGEVRNATGIDLPTPILSPPEWQRLRGLLPDTRLVRVALRHFGDTQALDLARDLRTLGFRGRLRAHGAVAARFYTLLRRSGFSEIELDARQARLQPVEHWRNETGWNPGPGAQGAGTI